MAHVHAPQERPAQIAAAQAACLAAGETLTPLRQRVLELLLDAPGPAKAYDLMEALKGPKGPAKPPTVYRALDFLVRVGLAHRIECLNAFVACDVAHVHGPVVFLICERCQSAAEVAAGHALVDLQEAAARDGFQIRRAVIEATGECARCRAAP